MDLGRPPTVAKIQKDFEREKGSKWKEL